MADPASQMISANKMLQALPSQRTLTDMAKIGTMARQATEKVSAAQTGVIHDARARRDDVAKLAQHAPFVSDRPNEPMRPISAVASPEMQMLRELACLRRSSESAESRATAAETRARSAERRERWMLAVATFSCVIALASGVLVAVGTFS